MGLMDKGSHYVLLTLHLAPLTSIHKFILLNADLFSLFHSLHKRTWLLLSPKSTISCVQERSIPAPDAEGRELYWARLGYVPTPVGGGGG